VTIFEWYVPQHQYEMLCVITARRTAFSAALCAQCQNTPFLGTEAARPHGVRTNHYDCAVCKLSENIFERHIYRKSTSSSAQSDAPVTNIFLCSVTVVKIGYRLEA